MRRAIDLGSDVAVINLSSADGTVRSRLQQAVGGPLLAFAGGCKLSAEFSAWAKRAVNASDYRAMAMIVRALSPPSSPASAPITTANAVVRVAQVSYMYTLHSEQLMDVKPIADLLGSFPPAVGALARIQHPIPSSAEPNNTKQPTSPVSSSESSELSDEDIALPAKEEEAVRKAVEAYRHAVDAGDLLCLERYGSELAVSSSVSLLISID
jgi:hypothetical protein